MKILNQKNIGWKKSTWYCFFRLVSNGNLRKYFPIHLIMAAELHIRFHERNSKN